MRNKLIFILIISLLYSCSRNPVINSHGISYLGKKQETLVVDFSNKNDVKKQIGSPSTIGVFDETIWIYIEKADTGTKITTLGKKKLLKNNVLVLRFDNLGILKKKEFFDKEDMEKIKFSSNKTVGVSKKQDFVYNFLSSIRQKMLSSRGID